MHVRRATCAIPNSAAYVKLPVALIHASLNHRILRYTRAHACQLPPRFSVSYTFLIFFYFAAGNMQ